ncbi:MAG: outer membrane beta-barrel protein, partial [Gemmatimonadota bacterium]
EDPTDDSDDDDVSRTNLDLALALLLHFRADPDNPVVYGLLRGSYDMIDENVGDDDDGTDEIDEESQTQLGLAVGIGLKLPIGEKLDVRLEGAYERRFENEDDFLPASNNYQLNAGFSWYTGSR